MVAPLARPAATRRPEEIHVVLILVPQPSTARRSEKISVLVLSPHLHPLVAAKISPPSGRHCGPWFVVVVVPSLEACVLSVALLVVPVLLVVLHLLVSVLVVGGLDRLPFSPPGCGREAIEVDILELVVQKVSRRGVYLRLATLPTAAPPPPRLAHLACPPAPAEQGPRAAEKGGDFLHPMHR